MVIVSFRNYLLYNKQTGNINLPNVIVSFRNYLLYNANVGTDTNIGVIVSFRNYLLYNTKPQNSLRARGLVFLS